MYLFLFTLGLKILVLHGLPLDAITPTCTQAIENMETCCKVPQLLFPDNIVNMCTTNPTTGKTTSVGNDATIDKNKQLYNGTCPMKCVFQNQQWLENGIIDFAQMEKYFFAKIKSNWISTLQNSFGTCKAEYKTNLKAIDNLSATPSAMITCKHRAVYFMSCLAKNMLMSCNYQSKPGPMRCMEKLEQLKQCNMFIRENWQFERRENKQTIQEKSIDTANFPGDIKDLKKKSKDPKQSSSDISLLKQPNPENFRSNKKSIHVSLGGTPDSSTVNSESKSNILKTTKEKSVKNLENNQFGGVKNSPIENVNKKLSNENILPKNNINERQPNTKNINDFGNIQSKKESDVSKGGRTTSSEMISKTLPNSKSAVGGSLGNANVGTVTTIASNEKRPGVLADILADHVAQNPSHFDATNKNYEATVLDRFGAVPPEFFDLNLRNKNNFETSASGFPNPSLINNSPFGSDKFETKTTNSGMTKMDPANIDAMIKFAEAEPDGLDDRRHHGPINLEGMQGGFLGDFGPNFMLG